VTLLCASPRCRIPNRHTDECQTDGCGGCLKARAADGLMLCWHCTGRIGKDAVEVARLWYEIGHILAAGGSTGVPAQNPHPGLVLNGQAADVRLEIRHVLASWCRLVAEERGIALPRDESQHTLGAYVRLHEQWLAATEYADEVADELAGLRGRAWATAYPETVSVVEIGTCPEHTADGEQCHGTIRAILPRTEDRKGNILPGKVACDADSTHEWTSERWRVMGRAMGKLWGTHQPAEVIATAYNRPIGTIYWLAARDGWRSVREGRRARYNTADVARTLEGMAA